MLKAVGLANDANISLTPMLLAIGGGFLTFLLITAMSCHIEKQRKWRCCDPAVSRRSNCRLMSRSRRERRRPAF
jgi:hypothetical protein